MPAANLLDRAIGWFAPRSAWHRIRWRAELARAYEAASPRDRWRPRRAGASPDADHLGDAATLRNKARALVQNVPYIRAGLEALVSHVVGTGIAIRWPNDPRATQAMAAWATQCDADGRLDLFGLQAAAYRAMEQDGEVLVRLETVSPRSTTSVPLRLRLIEADLLDNTRTSGAEAGNILVNGIEYSPDGRPAAYWLLPEHPGDAFLRAGGLRSTSQRVPASQIVHLYRPERPGQGRGFTRLAPVIARVRDLQLYEDAELARKNLESRLSVLVSGDASQMANPPQPGEAADPTTARATGDLGQLASGGITELPAGLNVQVVEPKAAPGHVEYVKHQLHIIAAGMGVTYEMLTGDMKEVNFSSARVRMLLFRRDAEATQWNLLIPRLLMPVLKAWQDAGELSGRLRAIQGAPHFSPPKWDYVNPQQEIDAIVNEMGSGLTSLTEQIRRRGDDPDRVFADMDADAKRLGLDGALDLMRLLLTRGKATPQDAAPVLESTAP